MPPDVNRPKPEPDGLVKKTLGFARVYSDVELNRTERVLEAELRRESIRPPPDKKVARLRLKGEHLLHSKHVLLTVVILNLIDCALVLGELILDIHFIRELRIKSDASSQLFINTLQGRYPEHLHGHDIEHMDLLYAQLYLAHCQWPNETMLEYNAGLLEGLNSTNPRKREFHTVQPIGIHGPTHGPGYRLEEPSNGTNLHGENEYSDATSGKTNHLGGCHGGHPGGNHDGHPGGNHGGHLGESHSGHSRNHTAGQHHEHSIWEHVAHGMHKASITILGILFVENILKLICMGRAFFLKKLEVFDALVVFISFVVDLVLLKGLMEFKVQDAVFVLTFLLPWRVIRVVNSLIVAVLDHEHFRLKMLYQEKKVVTAELKTLKAKEKGWDFHLKKIEHFCESEGIPKWKIRQHTAMGRKQSTITSMASLALNGFLKGMVLSPSDKLLLDKSLSLSTQDDTSLEVITESEYAADDEDVDFSRQTSQTNESESGLFYVTSDEGEMNTNKYAGPVNQENGVRKNVRADVETAHAHPEHSIMKIASKATIKSVTFDPKENKPLLHRQDSFEIKDKESNNDDENFKGWR